jgi:hypothetical protein
MTKKLTGTLPYQTPLNADLGTMAYQDADALGNITASSATLGGRTSSTSGQIDLTITRSVGGGGALKLIGDGYLTGGSHVIFEHTASSGASATTQNISYDGTQIYTNGNFKVSGLTFDPASGNTKTPTGLTMDDYEEGTWTPVLTNWTNVGTPTVTGNYTITGNLVYVEIKIIPATSVSSSSGNATMTLPISPANSVVCVWANGSNGAGLGTALVSTTDLWAPVISSTANTLVASATYRTA